MRDFKEEFDKEGYIFIPNLISESQCDRLVGMLENDYKKYSHLYKVDNSSTTHGLNDKSKEKVVYNLHNKNLEWYDLFDHPEIIKILEVVLMEGSYKDSDPYYMYTNSARCPLKGNSGQQLHTDSGLPGINYCIVANVLWMLDDFSETNGATRIFPRSHTFKKFAEDGKFYDEEILITGKKGGAIIFNANLWHGGGPNIDGLSRWALTLGYARWFYKPAFDYMRNMPKDIWENLSEERKKLLGFYLTPPKDEFTRLRRRSTYPESPLTYELPKQI